MTKSMFEVGTSRRSVLSTMGMGAALAAGGMSLSACSPGGTNQVVPGVIDIINKVISGTCSIVPVVATLVDVIVTVFPQAAGAATITDAVAKQIADFVCGLVKQAGIEADVKEGKRLAGPYKAKLNDTKTVDLHFYTVSNGKLVYI